MTHPCFKRLLRIALLLDTSTTWGRGIVSGINQYSRQQGNWHLFLEARGVEEPRFLPHGWRGDGVIARVNNIELARHLRRKAIPVVNVSGIQLSGPPFPTVTNDVEAVAKLAAQYFLDRGFRNFAYLSLRGLEYVARQRDAFRGALAGRGLSCSVLSFKPHGKFQSPDWNIQIEKLAQWIQPLPKPLAILSWNVARELIHACHLAGLRVPQEVAFLSGTEDELLCESSPVPISGVQADCERIGYEAAAQLDKLMHGSPAPVSPLHIPPIKVITRLSTDTMAISDAALVTALNFIQQNLSMPFAVDEVARSAGISRSSLERRFGEMLGISPAVHINHLRLDRVKTLLAETEMSIAAIAESSGFTTPEYMTAVFRKKFRMTPLRFRRERQLD